MHLYNWKKQTVDFKLSCTALFGGNRTHCKAVYLVGFGIAFLEENLSSSLAVTLFGPLRRWTDML
jgi:hypothetical protein